MQYRYIDIKNYLYEKYPPENSFKWDSDGVEVLSDENAVTENVLLCLDITFGAIDRAVRNGAGLILSHHPLLYEPVRKLDASTPELMKAMSMLRLGINAVSFHTRLDSADGGVNDALIKALDLDVAETGKFGNEENDSVGRIIMLNADIEIEELALRCKNKVSPHTAVTYLKGGKSVRKAAVVAGSGIMFLKDALKFGIDTFICGEASYNKLLSAYDSPERLNFLMLNHYESETVVLENLKYTLLEKFPKLNIDIYLNNKIKSV